MSTRRAIGCMTGTSLDALDASLVEIDGRGLAMHARHIRSVTRPLGSLQPLLRTLADQHPLTAGDIAALSRDFALLHNDAIRELLADERADLICVHGQTIFHEPPTSWQMFNAAPVVREFGIPVVCDLRAADLAAGGQGAPITPIADWVLLRESRPGAAVVNLGGFANATILPSESGHGPAAIHAMDICPCNQLLDRIARELLGCAFDEGGHIAASGKVIPPAAAALRAVFAPGEGRSLGTGDEAWAWVDEHRFSVAPADLAATACSVIGSVIAEKLAAANRGKPRSILLAGGGARNRTLGAAIASASGCPTGPIDEAGVPSAFRESICFAILGALCQDRVPITLPQVTGCPSPAPVAGVWSYPG